MLSSFANAMRKKLRFSSIFSCFRGVYLFNNKGERDSEWEREWVRERMKKKMFFKLLQGSWNNVDNFLTFTRDSESVARDDVFNEKQITRRAEWNIQTITGEVRRSEWELQVAVINYSTFLMTTEQRLFPKRKKKLLLMNQK